jgi:hypothetical protein
MNSEIGGSRFLEIFADSIKVSNNLDSLMELGGWRLELTCAGGLMSPFALG